MRISLTIKTYIQRIIMGSDNTFGETNFNPDITNRGTVMIWWNKLSLEDQFYYCIQCKELFITNSADRHPNTLTGSEIEKLYNHINN